MGATIINYKIPLENEKMIYVSLDLQSILHPTRGYYFFNATIKPIPN